MDVDALAILRGDAPPLPVIEFSYADADAAGSPVHMLWLDGHAWVSAHDLARIIGPGPGSNYTGLAMRSSAYGASAEVDTRLLANGAALSGTKHGTAVFLSEESTLGLLYCVDPARIRFRRWLLRDALPVAYRLQLPDLLTAAAPVKVHTTDTMQEEKEKRRQTAARRSRKRTSLYRFFDVDGVLLYVGISVATAKRISDHQRGKSWWRQVHSITHESFYNRARAEAAEAEAIRAEHPKYNIRGAIHA